MIYVALAHVYIVSVLIFGLVFHKIQTPIYLITAIVVAVPLSYVLVQWVRENVK